MPILKIAGDELNYAMFNRRNFLQTSLFSSFFLLIKNRATAGQRAFRGPVVITTWSPNAQANTAAWTILGTGGRSLDAVEKGIKVAEADPRDQSVGYGGLPDREGYVTLDACVMDENGNCGAVMAMEEVMHAISVARLVMEKTPHVQLAGAGALQFALSNGFKRENLLTEESKKVWQEWLKTAHYNPMNTIDNIRDEIKQQRPAPGQIGNHDTIGMIAIDHAERLSGGCSTSGMAFKMRGRVGDSPIIGAGLYVDNEVGAATATGVGEEVVRVCGSHTVVELMRQGYTPEEACRKTVERIVKHNSGKKEHVQVGFIALNKKGEYGAWSVLPGFDYAVTDNGKAAIYNAKSFF